jgi:hypothetical protein
MSSNFRKKPRKGQPGAVEIGPVGPVFAILTVRELFYWILGKHSLNQSLKGAQYGHAQRRNYTSGFSELY